MDFHTRRVEVATTAAFEMDAAFAWYEQRQPGLGTEFLRACEAAFSAIARAPALHRVVHANVRRALLRRFPFRVFFVESEDTVLIVGVVHIRQSPDAWP